MSDDVEVRAREMGWRPLEEFRGDPAKHISAEEFVQRGETLLPILKANSRKLEDRVHQLADENKRLAQLFAASQESITALQGFHEEATAAAVERAKRELKAQLVAAKEDGDVEAEVEIQDKLNELRAAPKPAPAPAPAPAGGPQVDPEMAAWMADNPWFGKDARKTNLAVGIANQLRADPENDHLQGRDFFDRVNEVIAERAAPGGGVSKVAGGRPSGEGPGGHGAGGKGYASLPPDAKAACDKQARQLVGEGRAFKDMAAWQSYYAKEYFRGEDK